MCKIIEDFVKEEREEARIEVQKEIALRMLKAGKNSIEEIAELVDLSVEELQKLKTE